MTVVRALPGSWRLRRRPSDPWLVYVDINPSGFVFSRELVLTALDVTNLSAGGFGIQSKGFDGVLEFLSSWPLRSFQLPIRYGVAVDVICHRAVF